MKETRSSHVSLLNPLSVWQPSPLLPRFLRLLWTLNLCHRFESTSAATKLPPAKPKFQKQSQNTFKAALPSLKLLKFRLSPTFWASLHARLCNSAGRLRGELAGHCHSWGTAGADPHSLCCSTELPLPVHADNSWEHQLLWLCPAAGQENRGACTTRAIRITSVSG